MSCRFFAAAIVTFAALMVLSGPVAASDPPLYGKAAKTAMDQAMVDTIPQGFNSWGTRGCRKPKKGHAILCFIQAEDDQGMKTKKCLLTYSVKKRSGKFTAKLRKKSRCVRNPYPRLTRKQALDAMVALGNSRAGKTVVVKRLQRLGRSTFAGTVSWVKTTETGNESCVLDVMVFSRKKIRASGWKPECESTDDKDNIDELFQRGPGPKYCPGNEGAGWNAMDDLIGKTLAEASRIAKQHECTVRPVKIDGVRQVVTMDLRFNRLNVEVEGPDQTVTGIDSVA